MRQPSIEANQILRNLVISRILWHEEVIEECSCDDGDDDCWYYQTEFEQNTARIDNIIRVLTEIRDGLRESEPVLVNHPAVKYPNEKTEAAVIVNAYLTEFLTPFEAWHHIDNADNDLLREVIKQLVKEWYDLKGYFDAER